MVGLFADGRRLLSTGGWESRRYKFLVLLLQNGTTLTEEPSFHFGTKQCLLLACATLFN